MAAKTNVNKALVVGVSEYSPNFKTLPEVANDVREIAKLLQSRRGVFSRPGVTLLTERKATRAAILVAVKNAFNEARKDQTVFVYLAGHGGVENDEYYFIGRDADPGDLANTAVPLRQLKRMFDRCQSDRVFLWLDCCHSGGILKKRKATAAHDRDVLSRTLNVVKGHGKVIIAACTEDESAYESSALGHGFFTHALLRGLRGEAEYLGEVSATSLFDFIAKEVTNPRQRPMLFCQSTGRIVLMSDQTRKGLRPGSAPASRAKSASSSTGGNRAVSNSGKWTLIDGGFFEAQRVAYGDDGIISVDMLAKSGEHEAALGKLRGNNYGRPNIAFAHRNDGLDVRVEKVSSESTGEGHLWRLALRPHEQHSGYLEAGSYVEGDREYSAADIAEMRAKLVLLNEPPAVARKSPGRFGYSLVENAVLQVKGHKLKSPLPEVFSKYAPHVRCQLGRLAAIYTLKVSHIVEDVLELSLGPVKGGKVAVKFRGVGRRQYSNEEPPLISVNGACDLSESR
jgi:uncharacterized caspase-like protein